MIRYWSPRSLPRPQRCNRTGQRLSHQTAAIRSTATVWQDSVGRVAEPWGEEGTEITDRVRGDSPFLRVPQPEWLAANRSAFAIHDAFPVSVGHSLVVPRRLIATWWEATVQERIDILALVDQVKRILDEAHAPDGYNVGFNAGTAAGQTVPHLHVHVIPRYEGDVPDPRGGIRHVIPGKGNYLLGRPESASGTSGDVATPTESTTEVERGLLSLVDGQERQLRDELLACMRDPRFDRIDLVVSFVMKSGLEQLWGGLIDAVDRGANLRVLTTDYLDVTDPDALARLLDLAEMQPDRVKTRVFQDRATSFHPKAYLFHARDRDAAVGFVGSNNLSASGIAGGIEWALGVDQVAPLLRSYERLWSDPRSRPLTHQLLHNYRQIRPRQAVADVGLGVIPEATAAAPTPRPVQREALDALERTRQEGYRAGLVVMATGLGKTWLAAFDTARPEFRRTLFVAHREEILRQSLEVFRRVQPGADLGFYFGGAKHPDARIMFASVQTLAGNLDRFGAERFDYVVIDEFHHAAARTYRKVIDHFRPKFLLGLTATPNRMDGADLLALCSDNLVYEVPLPEGIARGDLSPFRYYGVRDDVDYTPIPWRGGRFDPEALTRAVETQARAEHALRVWRERGGGRTLAFCVTVSHADFMARYFRDRGVAALAVHSGPTSAPRRGSIGALRDGGVEVIFTVDVFNEGLDVPDIDTVMMLRATESPVVFLQQLGRGLRKSEGKAALTVVDFIGNHRSFLIKPRTLLALGTASTPGTGRVLEAMRSGDFGLPPGCSVVYDPELVDILAAVARVGARSALEDYVQSYVAERGARPTALQVYEAGYNPAAVRSRHGHWFGFLDDLGLLEAEEQDAVRRHGDVLAGIETEPVAKSYKLVTLLALLRLSALRSGAGVAEVAWTAHQIVTGDPRLVADTRSKELPDPAGVPGDAWRDYWAKWPLAAWSGRLRGSVQSGGTGARTGSSQSAKAGAAGGPAGTRAWFRLEGRRFMPAFSVDDRLGEAFDGLVEEMVDYRLARYLFTKASALETVIRLRVIQTGGRPIIIFDRDRQSNVPSGHTRFRADGVWYTGNFVKIALNVVHREGQTGNVLPDLLRGWFGPVAGQPGTNHHIELMRTAAGWEMRPVMPHPVETSSETAG